MLFFIAKGVTMKFKSSLMIGSLALSVASHGSEKVRNADQKSAIRKTSPAQTPSRTRRAAAASAVHAQNTAAMKFVENFPDEQREYFVFPDPNFKFPFQRDANGQILKGDRLPNLNRVTHYASIEAEADEAVLVSHQGNHLFRAGRWVNLPKGKGWDDEKEEKRKTDRDYDRKKVVKIYQPLIQHGTWTIVRVDKGQLGYAKNLEEGRPMFLLPGSHMFNNPMIKFQNFVTLDQDIIQLDKSYTFVQINPGQQGLVNISAADKYGVLEPGLHLIEEPNSFKMVISSQKEAYPLGNRREVVNERGIGTGTYQETPYVTRGGEKIYISATLICKIVDPRVTFAEGFDSNEDLRAKLTRQATAILAQTIQGNSLKDEHGVYNPEHFIQETMSEFETRFIRDFGQHFGIKMESLTLGSFRFANKEMEKQLEAQALENGKISYEQQKVQMANDLALKRADATRQQEMYALETATKKAQEDAKAKQIEAEALAQAEKAKQLAELEIENARRDAEIERQIRYFTAISQIPGAMEVEGIKALAKGFGKSTVLASDAWLQNPNKLKAKLTEGLLKGDIDMNQVKGDIDLDQATEQ